MGPFDAFNSLLKDAGVSVSEAAAIFRVSRPTIYHWCSGSPPTQKVLYGNAVRLITAMDAAVKDKSLPVVDVEKRMRVNTIAAVLRKYLNT
jgi:hypothetical protein